MPGFKSFFYLILLVLTTVASSLLFYKTFTAGLQEDEKVNLLMFLMITNGFSLVTYIIHVVKNSSLDLARKLLWGFGIWGLHIPFSFAYWLLYINRKMTTISPAS